ncbi:MAG: DUF4922 domain-containing protein [Ignavibacteriales bacterium]|nr:DUF4922 domain-containing protein [Ignavibacteriales bacterium]
MNTLTDVKYTPLGNEIVALLDDQCKKWELCGTNYRNLASVKSKEFAIRDKIVKLQWNPARLTSTAAKVDARSISERKCFLCAENRPLEQAGVDYNQHFTVLVNPFPIFPKHYTIIHKRHIPQQIETHLIEMLNLSRALGKDFVVFYNGPQCGASAPDHHHFQAGNIGFLPIENEIVAMKHQAMATLSIDHTNSWFSNDGFRKVVIIEGDDASNIQSAFQRVLVSLQKLRAVNTEPLLNILSYYSPETRKNTILVLLREKHRPACYFKEGSGQIVLSPAAVDLGGVCITPRQEDFDKLTIDDLRKIFIEVFPSDEFLFQLQNEVSSML